jgi:hypothetical protein
MTREDIDNIISIICPNDEDFEKPIISPAYLKKELEALALEQESKTDIYEYHTDHTDCIWYGNDSGCPVTCSQYRDGWNDAMDYIFKNGKGYQPYRHDG